MNQFWIIRHGQSLSNAGLPTNSADDNVLTGIGEAQAGCVAVSIHEPPDLIVVSPYRRTHLTAAPLLQKFPQVPIETWSVQEFTYLSLPANSGTTHRARMPLSVAYWQRSDPNYVDGEGAESFTHLMQRAKGALERLQTTPGFTVLFSHSTFTKAILWQILEAPDRLNESAMRHFHLFHRGFRVPNASILKLELARDRTLRWSHFHVDHIPKELRTPTADRVMELQLADQQS